MPSFGEGSPFGQFQPTDLSAMLQAIFQPAPAPQYMAMPSMQRQQADFVDLGAGGPAPGSERASGLGALGQGLQGLSQVVGSAMAAGAAQKQADAVSAMGNSPGRMTIPTQPTQTPGIGGRTGGYVVNLPSLPTPTRKP